MASDQAKALLKDPSFWQKPDAERIQAVSSIDQDFAKFSPEDQAKALKLSEPKYRATAAPPGPHKRNEGAGKPKTQETLEQGLAREPYVMQKLFTPVTGAIKAGKGALAVAEEPTMRGKARGATDVLQGGLEMASPYAVEGLAMAPLKTFLTLAGGTAAGEATEAGAKAVGVPDEYSELVGTGAGILAGGRIAKGLRGRAKGAATATAREATPPSMPVRPPPLPETPRPPQESWKTTGEQYLRSVGKEAEPPAKESARAFEEGGQTRAEKQIEYEKLFTPVLEEADAKRVTGNQYVKERLVKEPSPAKQSAQVFKEHGPTHAENFEKAIQNENVRKGKEAERAEKSRKSQESKVKEPTPAKESAKTFKKAGSTYTELFDEAIKKEDAAKGPAASEKFTVGQTPEPPKAESAKVEVPVETPKAGGKEPWQMTRTEWRKADKQHKFDVIQKALDSGKKVSINTSEGKPVEISKTSGLKISQDGSIRTKDGRLLTDSQVDKMAEQSGMKVPPTGDKAIHGEIVRAAAKAGKPIPAEVLKEYPSIIGNTPEPPKSFQQKASTALRGGAVKETPIGEIAVDPKRFQFKTKAIGKGGTTDELRQVETFDPEKAGVVSVWRDPKDGKLYVVNGHHRLELAKNAGYKGKLLTQELKASNANEARLKGALINIAEGRGEAIDAAKIFRESKLQPDDIKKLGISQTTNLYKQGMALSKLSDHIFEMVATGDLPEGKGAAIGEMLDSQAQQNAAVDMLDKAEKRGKHYTDQEFKEALRLKVKRAPIEVRKTENLFGTTEEERSLALELGEVSEYVKSQLRGEKRLFGTVGNEGAAKRLGETGNVIKASENQARATETSQVQELYDRLSGSSGPVSEALDQAAKELGSGQSAAEVKSRAYDKVREALQRELSSLVQARSGAASRRVPPVNPVRGSQSSGRVATSTPPV